MTARPGLRLSLVQLLAVVRKEIQQTARDRRVMFLLVIAPLVQTVVFGFAVDFDVDRVPAVVVDLDRSPASRQAARRVLADGTLLRAGEAGGGEVDGLLERGEAAAALVLPPGFGSDLEAGRPARIQAVLDGADPNRSAVAGDAVGRFFGELAAGEVRRRAGAAGLALPGVPALVPRVAYNPGLRSAPYMVPGVLVMVLLVVTTIVTSMGLAREREMGTLEQVLVTPIRPVVLLAGKMLPFLAIGLLDVLLVLSAGSWIFDLPLRGSLLVLLAATLLYLLSTLGAGLLASTVSRTQQQSFLTGMLFIIPAMLLSGVVTPLRAMPAWLQQVTLVNPVRWFIEVVRANLLKGAGFADVWPRLLVQLALGVVLLAVATMRFQKRVA